MGLFLLHHYTEDIISGDLALSRISIHYWNPQQKYSEFCLLSTAQQEPLKWKLKFITLANILQSQCSLTLQAHFHLAFGFRVLLAFFYFKGCLFYFVQCFGCFQQRMSLGISFTVLPGMEHLIVLQFQKHFVPYSPWCVYQKELGSELPLSALHFPSFNQLPQGGFSLF